MTAVVSGVPLCLPYDPKDLPADMTAVLLLSVANPWGVVIVAATGLWLSWSIKYIRKLAGNTAHWVQLRRTSTSRPTNDAEDPTESTSLLSSDSRSGSSRRDRSLTQAFLDNRGIRDLLADSFFSKDLKTHGERLRMLSFTLIVGLLAFGVIVGGYFWAQIKVDGPARLASDTCGLWLFEGEKRSEAATRARMLDLEKEERAAQFASDCYSRSGSIATRCKNLHQPTLPIEAIYTNDCPFPNYICHLNRTITFNTPITNAKELGINGRSTPSFRRNTTCTPLSMEYPYIQNTTENGTTTFTYHYGSKQIGDNTINYTYTTVGNPWDRLAPIYDVFAYSSNSDGSDHPVWTPHPALTPPKYSTVTIIFVSSLRILYEQYSNDPIFPADDDFYLPGDPKAWFRNSDPRARPLACINTIEVCAPDGRTCWNFNEPSSNTSVSDDSPEYTLLYSALYNTDIYYSLAKRQGRSLLAQKKVSQYFSAALGDDPWIAEVESWVRTALARTSINAWSVASGEDSVHANKGGFVEVTKGYGDLCGRYKYNPQGYQSLRFVPLVLLLASLPLVWFLSRDGISVAEDVSPSLRTIDDFLAARLNSLLDGACGFLGRFIKWLLNSESETPQGSETSTVRPSSRTSVASAETDPSVGANTSQHTTLDLVGPTSASTQRQQDPESTYQSVVAAHSPFVQGLVNSHEVQARWQPLVLHLVVYFLWYLSTRLLVALVLVLGLLKKAF